MEFELNYGALLLGAIGGIVTIIVMKQVEVGVIWKILGFVGGAALGYIVAAWRLNAD